MLLTNAQKKNNKPLQQQQHQLQHEKENRRDKLSKCGRKNGRNEKCHNNNK